MSFKAQNKRTRTRRQRRKARKQPPQPTIQLVAPRTADLLAEINAPLSTQAILESAREVERGEQL